MTRAVALPQPLAPQTLVRLAQPVSTLEDAKARHAQLVTMREQVAAAIDTLTLALQQNHANYLAGRGSWPYEQKIVADTTLKTLKRQQQQLQDMYGAINRQLKEWQHRVAETRHVDGCTNPRHAQALQFLAAAQTLLSAETYTMLLDFADEALNAQAQS